MTFMVGYGTEGADATEFRKELITDVTFIL